MGGEPRQYFDTNKTHGRIVVGEFNSNEKFYKIGDKKSDDERGEKCVKWLNGKKEREKAVWVNKPREP